MPKQQQKAKAKGKKIGRSKKKIDGRGKPLSLFVRNRISAADYFRLTDQKVKN
jgi:hypothetical protein